ncbi:hypothetical protein [Nocardioides zeae]
MAAYVFDERWALPHPPAAVAEVLLDLAAYVDWWPQVVAVGRLGDDDALVLCRSTLPYDLELRLHAARRDLPVLEVAIAGTSWAQRASPSSGTVPGPGSTTARRSTSAAGSPGSRPRCCASPTRSCGGTTPG